MPVLSPISWVIVIAAFLQIVTGFGWWVTSMKLDSAYTKITRCQDKHQAFVDQTRRAGERAQERVKAIETEQQRIADETAKGWAAALDVVRADAARRVRLATNRGAGGSGLSQTAQTGFPSASADPDPIPASERVAADCAETTLTANYLQSYIERLQHE